MSKHTSLGWFTGEIGPMSPAEHESKTLQMRFNVDELRELLDMNEPPPQRLAECSFCREEFPYEIQTKGSGMYCDLCVELCAQHDSDPGVDKKRENK